MVRLRSIVYICHVLGFRPAYFFLISHESICIIFMLAIEKEVFAPWHDAFDQHCLQSMNIGSTLV
jgi:hypothetical protein